MSTPVPLADQIAEMKREHALRKNVYPAFIARGHMTEQEAAQHQERLSAAITTLEWLAKNEAKVRGRVGT